MAKLTVHENARVEVTIYRTPTVLSDAEFESAKYWAKRMIEDIKRHVDNVGHVTFEYDVVHYCSHCLLTWEELAQKDIADWTDIYPDAAPGMPLCCGEAYDEWHAAQQEVSTKHTTADEFMMLVEKHNEDKS